MGWRGFQEVPQCPVHLDWLTWAIAPQQTADSSTASMSEHAGDAAAGVGLDDDFLADPTEEREEVFPGVRLEGEQGPQKGPKLRFCPDSNDILYPREDRQRKVLVYFCKSCDHEEDANPNDQESGGWCVYRNEIHHTTKEKTVVLKDVAADPTLPRTNDVVCPRCGHKEAVFFSSSTEEGMTLFLSCTNQRCQHKWKDNV